MITLDNEHMTLFIESNGQHFEVTAICDDVLEANMYCEANPDEGVIAEDMQQGRVYIAKLVSTKGKPLLSR